MNPLLKKTKNIYEEGCVSIIMNTHRTKPDNQKDLINLKNLIKQAEERLLKDYDRKFSEPIIKNMNELSNNLDHNYNLESLIIYANRDFADFTRLPIAVEDRVVIADTFATRDLVRAMHEEYAYYVLVLSRKQARLIEAYNDKVIEEKKEEFPITNLNYTTDEEKHFTNKEQDKQIEEFFNQVDKIIWETTKDQPLPICLATETRNIDHFLKVTDKKDLIIGHINRNRDDEKAHHIVPDAWKVISELIKEKNANRIAELNTSISSGKFLRDFNEIWTAIQEGRGKTLFVKHGFYQPALLVDGKILLVEKFERDQKGVIDDIIDEMIEQNLSFGGDIVFLERNELDKLPNVALITRY